MDRESGANCRASQQGRVVDYDNQARQASLRDDENRGGRAAQHDIMRHPKLPVVFGYGGSCGDRVQGNLANLRPPARGVPMVQLLFMAYKNLHVIPRVSILQASNHLDG